ncbi:Pre-mRNA splicing factor Pro1/Prp6. HAT repeat protein [Cryptosporidium parvum Iowa II]|uniref:Pre-mRNA splicing factor Pro1/Prp6. HAT repeat protein n=1 Tax=Cryptosporidium parvum (strain Iowa II) TaxID=353152 RepID=Q5CRZ2_CRYPI|nr:Pre-mRNA splicing factor Pro1/Prp6. HAT repeat protein [Cryptosporidium parvum Iowa II]EAK88146.1 Pre-mRNA splicing factor Pro1/Prp6. HAT repeat protein [Cryptosporidium parvum Iowa II]
MNNSYTYPLGINSSDLQISKKHNIFGEPPPDYVPGKGRGAIGFASGVSRDDQTITIEADIGDYSDTKFDKFSGFNEHLFNDIKYDDDDRQADSIYEMIEEKLSTRRKKQKEKKIREEILKVREHRPTLQEQFSGLKKSLGDVKIEEWDQIPEPGDYYIKNKKPKLFLPVPDEIIQSSHKNLFETLTQKNCSNSELNTELTTELNELGTAKGNILSLKLDKAMGSVSGQSVIDPSKYLSSLNTAGIKLNGDLSDIKKARLLLKSVVNTNPKHSPGWIAAARFEEFVGRLSHAREIIAKGCEMCPKNEDIWLEAIRLGKPEQIDKIIVKSIKFIPNSTKVWMVAANRETNKNKKLLIIKKALEFIPNSIKLWKEAISLVDNESEKALLSKAVKCVPQSEELWLRYARLSEYCDAQKILNEARKVLPTFPGIWVEAAKLEEQNGKVEKVELIVKRCISNLSAKRFVHSRDDWLNRAGECEKEGYSNTCISIIKNTWNLGIDDDAINDQVFSYIDNFIKSNNIISARAMFESSADMFKSKEYFWIKWANFEEKYGNFEKVDHVLQKSLKNCPDKQILWLKAAQNQSANGNAEIARLILSKGYSSSLNDKEEIVLEAARLELSQGEIERAKIILERERTNSPSVQIWVESIKLENDQKNYDLCILYCSESVKEYPSSPNLWLLYGFIYRKAFPDRINEALKIYEEGLNFCSDSIELWFSTIELLMLLQNWKKARTFLDLARSKNKNQPELWMQTIKLEKNAGNNEFIPQILSKALKECPKSGLLYAESIFTEQKQKQKSKFLIALEQCGNDPYVLVAIAISFWKENDFHKSRKWFKSALEIDNKIGDTWIHYIAFELLNGDFQSQRDALNDFINATPNKGFEWNNIRRTHFFWDQKSNEILIICLELIYGIKKSFIVSNEIKQLLGLI